MPFAREDGDSIVTAWHRVDVLIPESYFSDPPLAEDLIGTVEVLGFFDVRAFEKEDSKPRKFGVRLPAKVRIRYTSSSTETGADEEHFRVFTSMEGEVLVDDVKLVQSSDNVSALFRILSSARITNVSYTDLANLFIEGAKLNGAGTGVTRSVLEAIVSELARYKKDPSTPLRIPLVAGKATEEDFRLVRLLDIPRLNSVFTGIGFQDIGLSVQSGVLKTMSGEEQHLSPMEELIRL